MYVSGLTASSDFPVTSGAYDTSFNGDYDVFLAKLDPSASSLVFATFVGGTRLEWGQGLAVDSSGNTYVTGYTESVDFPTTSGGYDVSYNGMADAFISVLDPNGTALVYSTFFGGSSGDGGWAIAVDTASDIYLTGWTQSSDLPTTPGAFDRSFGGFPRDSFLLKLRSSPGGNRPPVASAGPDQTVHKEALVTLDASNSYDPDADPLAFEWRQVAGAPVTLSNPGNVTTTFVPSVATVCTFELTVRDPGGSSASDTVDVTVVNRAPAAEAGPDVFTAKNSTLALDGSGSSDPDQDTLVYVWDQLAGPVPLTIANADEAIAFIRPPTTGVYEFQLLVIDADGLSSTDTALVTAVNSVPVADAGSDQSAMKRTAVVLDGTGSYDADGDPLTFAWAQVEGPSVLLEGADRPSAVLAVPLAGLYRFALTVTDSEGAQQQDEMMLISWGLLPAADLHASPVSTLAGVPIRFSGSGSVDPDGAIVSYAFDFGDESQAEGSVPLAIHSYAIAGIYNATLVVTDIDGNRSTDATTITVRENAVPLALISLSPSSRGVLSTVFGFDGSISSDADGAIVDYSWDFGDGTVSPGWKVVHKFSQRGVFQVSLTVTDDSGASAAARMAVEIRNRSPEILRGIPSGPVVASVGEARSFAVDVRDADGDPLTYVWTVDGRPVVGEGGTYDLRPTEAGAHDIRVTVSDGFEEVGREWSLIVREPPADLTVLFWGTSAAVLATAAAAVWIVSRRRRGLNK